MIVKLTLETLKSHVKEHNRAVINLSTWHAGTLSSKHALGRHGISCQQKQAQHGACSSLMTQRSRLCRSHLNFGCRRTTEDDKHLAVTTLSVSIERST